MMHRSSSSSWMDTSLVSSQKHPRRTGRETPPSQDVQDVSTYDISAFPVPSTAPGRLFHHQGDFKGCRGFTCLLLPRPGHQHLLPFVVFHTADKTSGIQDVLSKTTRAKVSHGASQHGNKHALFSRHVSICFPSTLRGEEGQRYYLFRNAISPSVPACSKPKG